MHSRVIEKTQDAVLLNIAVLGEAATRTVEEVAIGPPGSALG